MSSQTAKTLLALGGVDPVRMVPCTVVQVTPLLIDLLGAEDVPALKIAGASYSLGSAVALVSSPSKPLVIPIGA